MIIPNIWENKKCSKPPTRKHLWMHDSIAMFLIRRIGRWFSVGFLGSLGFNQSIKKTIATCSCRLDRLDQISNWLDLRLLFDLHLCSLKIYKIYNPDAPCMEYLPTFTPRMAQMWVKIPYMEYLGKIFGQTRTRICCEENLAGSPKFVAMITMIRGPSVNGAMAQKIPWRPSDQWCTRTHTEKILGTTRLLENPWYHLEDPLLRQTKETYGFIHACSLVHHVDLLKFRGVE